MQIPHQITYSIINEFEENFYFDILCNNQRVFRSKEFRSVDRKVVNFEYDYDQCAHATLKLILLFKSQNNKQLKLNSIKINNQHINIFAGFYYPAKDDWWKSLDDAQTKEMQKKVITHGGVFGWPGEVEYEYQLYSNTQVKKSSTCVLGGLPRLGNKGILL